MIQYFHRFARGLSLAGAYAAAFFIVFIAGIIFLEIMLRTFFSTSTYMMDELVGYSVAASAFLALGYTFDQREMIRITLILSILDKHPALRMAIEILCVVATLIVIGYLARYFYINLERQYSRGYSSGTMSGMPQWIPTAAVFVGLVIFWIQVASHGLAMMFDRPLLNLNGSPDSEASIKH